MPKTQVVIGFVGTSLDIGRMADRWQRWRPTVALCQQPDFIVDRLELLHDLNATALTLRLADDIKQISPETQVRLHLANLTDAWDFGEVYGKLHDFARAYAFALEEEDYFVNITTGTHVAQICWFLLTEARTIPAKLLQLSPPKGANKNIAGSMGVIDLDLSRYDQIVTRFSAERDDATSFLKSGIPTRNAAFNRMIDEIEKVAIKSRAPFLITGPTGAGKSQLARRVYELKQARHQISGPFVEVNCATLRGDQAMSALFGHIKGAFTGAQADRPGLLKSAHKGLLFLDEIGELGGDEQAMILRAIEEKRFLPLGADKETASDFQLIAGTNRDLGTAVREGRFREDLLARLNLWTFELPALRDRLEDIEPNIAFELQRFSERDRAEVGFNKEARQIYLAFAMSPEATWNANFRDLAASITRMATLAPGGRINQQGVADEIVRLRRLWNSAAAASGDDPVADLLGQSRAEKIDPFDRPQLAAVIRQCRASASLSAAGRALFAASRQSKTSSNDADRLRKYLARFELTFETVRG